MHFSQILVSKHREIPYERWGGEEGGGDGGGGGGEVGETTN